VQSLRYRNNVALYLKGTVPLVRFIYIVLYRSPSLDKLILVTLAVYFFITALFTFLGWFTLDLLIPPKKTLDLLIPLHKFELYGASQLGFLNLRFTSDLF